MVLNPFILLETIWKIYAMKWNYYQHTVTPFSLYMIGIGAFHCHCYLMRTQFHQHYFPYTQLALNEYFCENTPKISTQQNKWLTQKFSKSAERANESNIWVYGVVFAYETRNRMVCPFGIIKLCLYLHMVSWFVQKIYLPI